MSARTLFVQRNENSAKIYSLKSELAVLNLQIKLIIWSKSFIEWI